MEILHLIGSWGWSLYAVFLRARERHRNPRYQIYVGERDAIPNHVPASFFANDTSSICDEIRARLDVKLDVTDDE